MRTKYQVLLYMSKSVEFTNHFSSLHLHFSDPINIICFLDFTVSLVINRLVFKDRSILTLMRLANDGSLGGMIEMCKCTYKVNKLVTIAKQIKFRNKTCSWRNIMRVSFIPNSLRNMEEFCMPFAKLPGENQFILFFYPVTDSNKRSVSSLEN